MVITHDNSYISATASELIDRGYGVRTVHAVFATIIETIYELSFDLLVCTCRSLFDFSIIEICGILYSASDVLIFQIFHDLQNFFQQLRILFRSSVSIESQSEALEPAFVVMSPESGGIEIQIPVAPEMSHCAGFRAYLVDVIFSNKSLQDLAHRSGERFRHFITVFAPFFSGHACVQVTVSPLLFCGIVPIKVDCIVGEHDGKTLYGFFRKGAKKKYLALTGAEVLAMTFL